jgi:hypothetical protein
VAYLLATDAAGQWFEGVQQQQQHLLWGAAFVLPSILTWWLLWQAVQQPRQAAPPGVEVPPAVTAPDPSSADTSHCVAGIMSKSQQLRASTAEAGKQTSCLPSAPAQPSLGLLPSGPSINLESSSEGVAQERSRVLQRLRSKSATDGPSTPLVEAPPARRVQSSGPTCGHHAAGPGATDSTPFLRWPLERYASPVVAGVLLIQVGAPCMVVLLTALACTWMCEQCCCLARCAPP